MASVVRVSRARTQRAPRVWRNPAVVGLRDSLALVAPPRTPPPSPREGGIGDPLAPRPGSSWRPPENSTVKGCPPALKGLAGQVDHILDFFCPAGSGGGGQTRRFPSPPECGGAFSLRAGSSTCFSFE
ncbi:hypothetical protein NN561_001116 [Cricetulus griseus]